jgi:ATP-dependent Clp protease ATP-binding subunit ClpX
MKKNGRTRRAKRRKPKWRSFPQLRDSLEAHLLSHVKGQDSAVRDISLQMAYWYFLREDASQAIDLPSPRILVRGPSGSGKTYMLRLAAKFMGVAFAYLDLSQSVPVGYMGSNLSSTIDQLLACDEISHIDDIADGVIIMFDECDKRHSLEDDYRSSIATELLTYLGEPGLVPYQTESSDDDDDYDDETTSDQLVDLSKSLLIAAGVFAGESNDFEKEFTHSSLLEQGFSTELARRFTQIVQLRPLEADDLRPILEKDVAEYRRMKLYSGKGIDQRHLDEIITHSLELGLGAPGARNLLQSAILKRAV